MADRPAPEECRPEELREKLGEHLFFVMEKLLPEHEAWESLREDEREFYRLSAEMFLNRKELIETALQYAY